MPDHVIIINQSDSNLNKEQSEGIFCIKPERILEQHLDVTQIKA